jgi:hypothetical protein
VFHTDERNFESELFVTPSRGVAVTVQHPGEPDPTVQTCGTEFSILAADGLGLFCTANEMMTAKSTTTMTNPSSKERLIRFLFYKETFRTVKMT